METSLQKRIRLNREMDARVAKVKLEQRELTRKRHAKKVEALLRLVSNKVIGNWIAQEKKETGFSEMEIRYRMGWE